MPGRRAGCDEHDPFLLMTVWLFTATGVVLQPITGFYLDLSADSH